MKDGDVKKAVVLLGAGFAQSFGGPSSDDLFKTIIKKSKNEGVSLPDLILSKLDNYYGKDNYNFETYIAVLEAIETFVNSYTAGNQRSPSESSVNPSVFKIDEEILQAIKDDVQGKNHSPSFLFRDLIELCILAIITACHYDCQYNVIDNKDIQQNKYLFLKFVRAMLHQGYTLKFYTTNYDRLIPEILRDTDFEIEEGFERCVPDTFSDKVECTNGFNVIRDDFPFHYDMRRFCNAKISHFNLHGSKYLNYKEGNIIYSSSESPWRITEYLPVDGGNPNGELYFRRIIVGGEKTQRVFSQPFAFGFNTFAYDCNTCCNFFSFGYSFRDPHINATIGMHLKCDVKFECVVKERIAIDRHTPDFLQHLSQKSKYQFEDKSGIIREHTDGIESYLKREGYLSVLN